MITILTRLNQEFKAKFEEHKNQLRHTHSAIQAAQTNEEIAQILLKLRRDLGEPNFTSFLGASVLKQNSA